MYLATYFTQINFTLKCTPMLYSESDRKRRMIIIFLKVLLQLLLQGVLLSCDQVQRSSTLSFVLDESEPVLGELP